MKKKRYRKISDTKYCKINKIDKLLFKKTDQKKKKRHIGIISIRNKGEGITTDSTGTKIRSLKNLLKLMNSHPE